MSDDDSLDYAELAQGLDQMREVLAAMVAALIADGFTEEQAREITTAIFSRAHRRHLDPRRPP
jgi:uncharacterized membrane protein YebE (DUF533 family)